ncbi:hypothetical protein PUNNY_88 [Escherichia phage_vB_EcoD_Punny]|nr:hypothetical protein PUNNY_88 [Escherichia phage_vB_EcoD_Punny]
MKTALMKWTLRSGNVKNGKAVDKVGFVGRCIMVNVEKFR